MYKKRTILGMLMLLVVGLLCFNWNDSSPVTHIISLCTDLTLLGLLLWFLPKYVSTVVRIMIETIVYSTALIDTYCLYNFGKGLSPTMLIIFINTTDSEIADFLRSYGRQLLDDWHTILLILLVIVHLVVSYKYVKRIHWPSVVPLRKWIMVAGGVLLMVGTMFSFPDKQRLIKLLSQDNISDMEGLVFRNYDESAYISPLRLAYALRALRLSEKEIVVLREANAKARIDSCSYRSRHIVLVIGESYNRHHTQLYDYPLPTTPKQLSRVESGQMTVFTDVVSSWNITTNSFNQMFSLHHYGALRPWSSYPLFPSLFRQAGYRVAFLTNQFARHANRSRSNQTGGFFINDRELFKESFDVSNRRQRHNDMAFLKTQMELLNDSSDYTLDIIHLHGQHFDYASRYPSEETVFTTANYQQRQLSDEQRQVIAHYDNATRWNDIVLDAILRSYENQDAVVICLADHGEEVYDDLPVKGRIYSELTARQVRQEFEIPFWIWCSPIYAELHPDIIAQIQASAHRPWMTDRLPHLLLYLAGISQYDYDERLSLIGPHADGTVPRKLEGTVDYDALIKNE
ncbi:MAG: phosphoethanolamine transferase [Bacteroidaceae bacterium]|nr:phosphoethanolamine transferase [Bacteroidaceae bacterium]